MGVLFAIWVYLYIGVENSSVGVGRIKINLVLL